MGPGECEELKNREMGGKDVNTEHKCIKSQKYFQKNYKLCYIKLKITNRTRVFVHVNA